MIFCNLQGGLGNMFFQIAATISLSIDNDVDFCFPNLNQHLDYLNADNHYNSKLNHSKEYLIFLKNLQTFNIQYFDSIIKYPFDFVKKDIPKNNVLIDGFFQSEKYFKHNRETIIKTFDFKNNISLPNKYKELLDNKCTSIHVRRGDYVKYPNLHPTQSLEYYLNSIYLLSHKTDIFLVFSDDINWCKENLKIDNAVYIEKEKDYIELYLMSLCDNNIISNSSFSWWGAWLNEKEDKTVIGPEKWFGNDIKHNTGDIIPEDWIKL